MPKTLTDIIPPSKRRTMEDMQVRPPLSPPPTPLVPEQHDDMSPPPVTPTAIRPRRRGFPFVTAFIALVVVIASVGVLFAFGGAEAEVTPAAQTTPVEGDFSATPSSGELPYEVVTVEKIASQQVPAESESEANDPAQGSITVYNESGETQRFVTNTRFESPEGLIFKVREAIVIPAGTSGSPGTVTVTVYAESGGEKYNIGPSNFTLPGLDTSPLGKQVYAKSSSAFTGGFSGTRPSVSTATREAEQTKLKTVLETDLLGAVDAQVPSEYVLLPGATFLTFETQPDTSGAQGTVDVRLKGVMTAIVFPNKALAKAIATKTLGTYNGEPVMLSASQMLVLKPLTATAPTAEDAFDFTLSGETMVVWEVDPAKIAGAVAGKKRASAETIVSTFPEVGKAVLTLRPFWSDTFPNDPGDIKVTLLSP